MPIGVNYTGLDGRTVRGYLPSLRGQGPDLKGSLKSLRGSLVSVRDAKSTVGGFVEDVKSVEAKNVKATAGGSVKVNAGVVSLDGDAHRTANVKNGTGFYGMTHGVRQWVGLDDIDPRGKGGPIGDPTSISLEEQQDCREPDSTVPFTDSSISRLMIEDDDGKAKLWAYVRDRSISGGGRTFAVSGERRILVGFTEPHKATALPFEPSFEDDGEQTGEEVHGVKSMGAGFIPLGREFIGVSPSEIEGLPISSDGLVCLVVNHELNEDLNGDGTYSVSPTCRVIVKDCAVGDDGRVQSLPDVKSVNDSGERDLDNTTLPLYVVSEGAIVLDLRCYLAISTRE